MNKIIEKIKNIFKFNWSRDMDFTGCLYIVLISIGIINETICKVMKNICFEVSSILYFVVNYLYILFSVVAFFMFIKFIVYIIYKAFMYIKNQFFPKKTIKKTPNKKITVKKPVAKKVVKKTKTSRRK